jgi:hypothetical protein
VLERLIYRLEERFPWLGRWLGERPDIQLPAIGVSLVSHLVILVGLGMVGYAAHSEIRREFRTEVVNTSIADFDKLNSTEIVDTDKETTILPSPGSFSPNARPLIVESPLPPKEAQPLDLAKPKTTMAASISLPTATKLDQVVSIKGTGSEHVGSVEGAVDRVAVEIVRQMEKGRTLVVWAFDASGSLHAERQRLAKYIDGVYGHITQLDKDNQVASGGLLTVVYEFGKDRKPLTSEPTNERQAIISAIESVSLDTTGIESTFTTVGQIATKFGKYTKDGQHYRTLIIVVTDEVGDDEDRLEDAIRVCQTTHTPVYVLGNGALFGRTEGYMDYVDPKTKQMYRNLPVRQGPESPVLESIRLPFWYDGPQYEFMDAGFGSWALSRLAGATEGIYFVTRMGGHRIQFDPAGMREYQPDWVSRRQYVEAVNKHPVRLAVMKAAEVAQQNLPSQPPLTFPAADGPQFKEAMFRNQEVVARIQYTVDAALVPITIASKKRDHETSRRWQAHYDLIRGRLLAMKLRCYEYNSACAKMKKDAPKFTKPASNAWRLVPDEEIRSSDKAATVAEEAKTLLKRVVTDHPGTPWALMAQRELKDPFGFKWVETTMPPPPKPNDNAAEAKKKNNKPMTPPKPVELPKL